MAENPALGSGRQMRFEATSEKRDVPRGSG
jgi:hypothetical protein